MSIADIGTSAMSGNTDPQTSSSNSTVSSENTNHADLRAINKDEMLEFAEHYDELNANLSFNGEQPSHSSSLQMRELQHRWLRNNLPVIVQPQHDIDSGNELVAVF